MFSCGEDEPLVRLLPCSTYVMNPRDIRTAPRWKLKPWNIWKLQQSCWYKDVWNKIKLYKLTCKSALAMYVTMMAVNVPNLTALLKTSERRIRGTKPKYPEFKFMCHIKSKHLKKHYGGRIWIWSLKKNKKNILYKKEKRQKDKRRKGWKDGWTNKQKNKK